MGRLPPPEHDRHLDLRALVEEALDVAFLGVVVVDSDLRPELDLLDVDLRLVLSRELRLLLELVAVLAVVHHLDHGRVRLPRDLDQVEALVVRVLLRVVRALDAELRTVRIDQPHARNTDVLVDPAPVLRRALGQARRPAPRPQRLLTKLPLPPLSNEKTAASSGPDPRPSTRFEPPGASAREVRNGSAPTCRPTE